MHPYIPHLLEDITAAHKTDKSNVRDTKSFEKIVSVIEILHEGPGHTFGYYCGLDAKSFPPPEQLLKKDMKLVCSAFKKMMLSWNIKCYLPKEIPQGMIYTLLIKTLERRIDPMSSLEVTFAFCSVNPHECILKEYCTCLKHKNSDDGHFVRLL